jgi:hypothetical protein
MKTSPLIPSTLLKLSSSKVKGEKVGIPDQAVSTYSGDWDLHLEPINEFGATCNQNLDNPEEPIPVMVGRHGDLVLCNSVDQTKIFGRRQTRVVIAARHPGWVEFRERLRLHIESEGGILYAPIDHPDLFNLKSWTGKRRMEAVLKNAIKPPSSILDIGAQLGHMCFKFAALGHKCVALEIEPDYCELMKTLQRAVNSQFEIENSDFFTYTRQQREFDTVLSLAVFHHFIKKKQSHDKLFDSLERLSMKEMFLWTHNEKEDQMINAYRNQIKETKAPRSLSS